MNKKGNYQKQGDKIAITIEGTEMGFEELPASIRKYIELRIGQGYDHGSFVEVQFPSEENREKELQELIVRQTEIKVLIANELFASYSERDFIQCESDQIDEIKQMVSQIEPQAGTPAKTIQVDLSKTETELVLKGLELLVNNFEQLKLVMGENAANAEIDKKGKEIIDLIIKISKKIK